MQVEDNTQEVTANEDGMLSRRTLFIIGCAAVIVVTLLIIGIVMVFASGNSKAGEVKDCSDGKTDIEGRQLRYQYVNNERGDSACKIGGEPRNDGKRG